MQATAVHPSRVFEGHRVSAPRDDCVLRGEVHYAPIKSLWFIGMALVAVVGGVITFTWTAFGLFVGATAFVLLFGHSLGSHRKLIHDSFQCPKWLEYALVWSGVQVGLAGPLGLLRQHELRDYAQRLPDCHDYLRHGRRFWVDAWWQLHCELRLADPPRIRLEPRIADDRFYRFLERTWMLQQLPPAALLFALGGWPFVIWGVCARVTAGVFGHWLIGFFAHNVGGMHHEVRGAAVQGRNIRLASLLTMGECWHNNHHAFPGSARLGLYAGEWDPGWWTLVMLKRLGFVHSLRLPGDLRPRSELLAIDATASAPASLVHATSSAAPIDLETLLAQILGARASRASRASRARGDVSFHGPAASIPPRALQWIAGPDTVFERVPGARRMTWRADDTMFMGLPALCMVLASRSTAGRVIAAIVAPLAWAVERTRLSLTVG